MVTYTKRQVIDHIHRFLAIRLSATGPLHWTCVLRDGRLKLIAPCRVLPKDIILADYSENLNGLPLRTVIHEGVNRNWDVLITAMVKIQEPSLQIR